jgi:hypothetical protein
MGLNKEQLEKRRLKAAKEFAEELAREKNEPKDSKDFVDDKNPSKVASDDGNDLVPKD